MTMGPNVRKVYLHRAAALAIPEGGTIADGVGFFLDPVKRSRIMLEARRWTDEAIATVRTAPDLPESIDDEEIAALILEKLQTKQAAAIARRREAR
jgi:hypothetical protein